MRLSANVNGSLTSLGEKLIEIGAKVVSHGRDVTFQVAEVAIPRTLLDAIMQGISALRPPSMAHLGTPGSAGCRVSRSFRELQGEVFAFARWLGIRRMEPRVRRWRPQVVDYRYLVVGSTLLWISATRT